MSRFCVLIDMEVNYWPIGTEHEDEFFKDQLQQIKLLIEIRKSMSLTTDRDDPCLRDGQKDEGQNSCYLVLSEEERAKGFVRPVRTSYKHVGHPKPEYPLRDLTDEEKEQHGKYGWVKYEKYPEGSGKGIGRYYTQKELDGGCNSVTTMGQALAETYARDPGFYGATFCVSCNTHLPVKEFVWAGTDERVGS